MTAFLSVVVCIFCILLSGWIAGRRGRSAKLWYWLGAIFGPFAALAVALLPPATEHTGRPPGDHPPEPALGGRRTPGRTSEESHPLDIVLMPVA